MTWHVWPCFVASCQDYVIPNRNPGKVGTLKRLIKVAEAQFVTDNATAAATEPGTASYTDFLEKMKKEPKKAARLPLTCSMRASVLVLQVHIDIRSKLAGISLEALPLECLPEGA